MNIKGMGHIAVNSGDYSKSIVFYRDILGFKEESKVEWEEFSITNLRMPDGGLLELFDYGMRTDRAQQDNSVVGYRHFAFLVDDVDEVEAHLVANNVPIKMSADTMPDLGIRGMLCLDPDGTEVEFYHLLEK